MQLQQQNDRVTKLNSDYRRKTKLTQRQAQNLISEKVELQGELHDKEQLIEKIKEQMDEHQNHSLPSPVSCKTLHVFNTEKMLLLVA